jgi:hypothetical protein
MRRALAALALLAVCIAVVAIVLTGGGRQRATSPLDDALGYFPRHAPLVAAVETDPDGPQGEALATLLSRVPVATALLEHATAGLSVGGFDARDLSRLRGNPLVAGLERAPGVKSWRSELVVAIRVPDPDKAKQLLLRQHDLLPRRQARPPRIFQSRSGGRFAAAVDGTVLVAGGSRAAVAKAIAQRRSAERMRASEFEHDLAGLPPGAGVRVDADPRALIAADPRLRRALRVPWITSLRRAAATVKAEADGIALTLRVRTDPRGLSSADLPLSPGTRPLPVIGRAGEVAIGVADPARLVRFALAVERALAPERAARAAELARIVRGRGVDLARDFLARLGGTAALALDPVGRSLALRVPVREPAAFTAALDRVADSLPDLAAALGIRGLGVATPEAGGRFYALARAHGTTLVFGVVGSALIAASRPRRAAALVSEGTRVVPRLGGALVATVDAQTLALRLLAPRLRGLAAVGAPLALAPLGDVTAAVRIDRSALTATAKLPVR